MASKPVFSEEYLNVKGSKTTSSTPFHELNIIFYLKGEDEVTLFYLHLHCLITEQVEFNKNIIIYFYFFQGNERF